MDYKRLKIKTITPMLSHGLNDDELEFRVTELKAAMRFWWRAINTFENLEDMKKKEGILFGDSKNNSSPFRMRAKEKVYPKNRKTKVKGIHINKDIEITLYSNKLYDSNLEFYVKLIKLVSFLGGLGRRSRRSYGVFAVDEGNNVANENKKLIQNLNRNIQEEIQELVQQITNQQAILFKELNFNKINCLPKPEGKYMCLEINKDDYSLEYPYIKKIYISESNFSWKNLISRIDKAIYRTKNKYYYYNSNKAKRFACPVYVTCFSRHSSNLTPIIVELNNTREDEVTTYKKYINKFKEAVLKKGAENE